RTSTVAGAAAAARGEPGVGAAGALSTPAMSSASDAEPIPASDKRWYAAHDPTRSGVSGIAGSCRGAGAAFTPGTTGAAAGGEIGRDAGAGRGAGAGAAPGWIARSAAVRASSSRSEEHTSELQSLAYLV